MYSPYVSWYQVPKGYSKPKPLTEMFTKVKKTNNMQTLFENMQCFPVALFVSCSCDLQNKLMMDRKFDLRGLSDCDNYGVIPEPLDLSVKSVMKKAASSCNNVDLKGNNCHGSDIATNMLSDNKENCLPTVNDSSSDQLKVQKTDDALVSTNTSSHHDNNERSLSKKEHSGPSEIQKPNLKAVKRIDTKRLNRKIMKLRRRWSTKAFNAMTINEAIISSLINSAKRQLFPKRKKKVHYRDLGQTKKKSVPCQTTWETEQISSRSTSMPATTSLVTHEANDDPAGIAVQKVTQEMLHSNNDPLLSINMSKIGQETNTECNRSDSKDSSVKLLAEEKEMPSQDFSMLMDLDGFSTDKLLDLLSVEYDVFGNGPNGFDNLGPYATLPNGGSSHVDDEGTYISNAELKRHNQEESAIKREDKDRNSALDKDRQRAAKCEMSLTSPNPIEFNLEDKIHLEKIQAPSEQLSNVQDTLELTREYVPSNKSGVTRGTMHVEQPEACDDDDTVLISNLGGLVTAEQKDENNNNNPPSIPRDAEPEKIIAEQEKNVATKIDSSISDLVGQKYVPPKNSRKRRGGTLRNNKRNKRLRNDINLMKELASKTSRKLLKNDDQKKRETQSYIRKPHRVTRSSSKRRRALCFCEKNVPTSLEKIDDTTLEKKDRKHGKLPFTNMSDIKKYSGTAKEHWKYDNPSLKIKIPLSDLNLSSSRIDDIVGKIIEESTASKMIDPPTLLKSRNPHLIKQKNKVQSNSSIDFTFLPDYVPALLKNSYPSLTPVHEPAYNFPSQSLSVTVPIAEKKKPPAPLGQSQNGLADCKRLARDPRLRSRKRKKSLENEDKDGTVLDLPEKRAKDMYPNVSVSKEDLDRNTFLITEILRDAVSYGICATYGIALFDSKAFHQCPEMETIMGHPYNQLELVSDEYRE